MLFSKLTADQLKHRYSYHAPKGDQAERYSKIRESILNTAILCVDLTPCSPEQMRALNALDEAMFLFNAAIARSTSDMDDTTEMPAMSDPLPIRP